MYIDPTLFFSAVWVIGIVGYVLHAIDKSMAERRGGRLRTMRRVGPAVAIREPSCWCPGAQFDAGHVCHGTGSSVRFAEPVDASPVGASADPLA